MVYIGSKRVSDRADVSSLSASQKRIYDKLPASERESIEARDLPKQSTKKGPVYSYTMEVKDFQPGAMGEASTTPPPNKEPKTIPYTRELTGPADAKPQFNKVTSGPGDYSKDDYIPPRTKSPQETDTYEAPAWGEFTGPQDIMSRTIDKEQPNITEKEKYTPKQPIKNAWDFADTWGQSLEYHEERTTGAIKQKQETQQEAMTKSFSLASSQETINPEQYAYNMETYQEPTSGLSFKETGILLGSNVVFGVAEVGQGALSSVLNLKDTGKGLYYAVSHPGETAGAMVSAFKENPGKEAVKLATEVYLFNQVTKGIKRIVKPKVTDTPIKAKGIKVLETVRKTKSGKLVKDTQIQIDTTTGKPVTRNFWEKSKVKPRKVLDIEADRLSKTYTDAGLKATETGGKVKGKLNLKGDKAKFTIKEYTETRAPVTSLEPATKYTGKTKSGIKLEGETGKLKPTAGAERVNKIRAEYSYKQLDKVEGVYSNSEFFIKTEPGKYIKVPQSTTNKINILDSKLYRNKPTSGSLSAEIQYSGGIVKRKYTPRTPKPQPKPGSNPQIEIILDKKGGVKSVKDFTQYQTTESGQVLKLGRKPTGYQYANQGLIMESVAPVKTVSRASSPIVDVITTGGKVKGIPGALFSLEKETTTKTKPGQEAVLELETKTKGGQKAVLDSLTKTKGGQEAMLEMKPRTKPGQEAVLELEPRTKGGQEAVLELTMEQKPGQEAVLELLTETKTEQRIFEPETITKKEIIIFPFATTTTTPNTNTEQKKDGYNTYLFEDGRKVKANVQPNTKQEAERLGRDIADNSLSASYRVSKINQKVPASRRSRMATGFNVSPSKFTESRSNSRRGFFIEKKSFRLDTQGERSGIKASRLIAERRKGLSAGGSSSGSVFGGSSKKNNKAWRLF